MSIVEEPSCTNVLVIEKPTGECKFKARTTNRLYTFVVEDKILATKVKESLGPKLSTAK